MGGAGKDSGGVIADSAFLMTITPVHNWQRHWSTARPHLVKVCERVDDMTIDDIYDGLKTDNNFKLVMMPTGAAVIRLEDQAVHVVGVGGKFEKGWTTEFTSFLLDVAMITGRSKATLGGRKGWLRALKPLGWVPTENGMEVYYNG